MTGPLYKRVSKTVIERIVSGTYAPGAMLPNEFELAADMGVSQGTARKALTELENQGIVQRRQGKGTFVTLRTPENSLFHFFRLRTKDGQQVTPEIKAEQVIRRKAKANERDRLHGAPKFVFEVNRTRLYHGKPLCFEKSILPVDLFPGLIERQPLPNALYVLFQQAYSCIVISAEEHIKARAITAEEATALEVPTGIPTLAAERLAKDLLGRVVEIRQGIFLTENFSYFVELD